MIPRKFWGHLHTPDNICGEPVGDGKPSYRPSAVASLSSSLGLCVEEGVNEPDLICRQDAFANESLQLVR